MVVQKNNEVRGISHLSYTERVRKDNIEYNKTILVSLQLFHAKTTYMLTTKAEYDKEWTFDLYLSSQVTRSCFL